MFSHPLALLALAAVPAVVLLHLFRRRFRRVPVSALFLFADTDERTLAGRKRMPLVTSPSFWLEVLTALLLALAFAGPRGCGASERTHLVAVLDGSASMGARADDGTLRDRAVGLLEARIEELGAASRVTIVESGPRPRVLAGPGALAGEARAALAAFAPDEPRHDPSAALALAEKIAAGGSVLFVTDRFEPEELPGAFELLAVGEPLENAAIVRARRFRARDGERVELSVVHHGRGLLRTRVELTTAAGEVVQQRALDLEPAVTQSFALDLPEGAPALRARLADGGALAVDDVAHLAPAPPRTLALGTTLAASELAAFGIAARGASSTEERLARWLALVPDAVTAPPELAHVVFGPFTGEGPRTVFVPHAAEAADPRDWIGPFLLEKRHPLLSGVTLEGVIWSADAAARLPGSPLVSAGDVPLLTEVTERGGARTFHLALDPTRSTLTRSPDWPILLANLAELARAELPGPERTTLSSGEPFVYRARREATYRLVGPAGEREVRAREVLVLEDEVVQPGEYELRLGQQVLARFGVTFADPAESDLSSLASGTRAAQATGAVLEAGASPLLRALALGALLLVVLDWLWLARGWRASEAPV